MNQVLIGIDVGTTVLKAAAFDARSGKALGVRARRLTTRTAAGGVREQSVMALDRAISGVLAELRTQLAGSWRHVAGLGLAAQGGSMIIVDRETGRPCTPLVLWNDTRAAAHLDRIRRATAPAFWRRRTLRDAPGAGLGRILWMQEHRPELVTDSHLYVGVGDYLYYRLTGVWRQDAGHALQTGCYNARRQALDQDLFDTVKIPLAFVPPLRNGHEIHPLSGATATRLRLPAGTPVAGPYMDHEAGCLSAAAVSHRPLQCSLGTAWVGNFVLARGTKWTSPIQLALPDPGGPNQLVVQPLLTGNVVWDAALTAFADRDHGRALRHAARLFGHRLLPPEGLAVLPWRDAAQWAPRGAGSTGGLLDAPPHAGDDDRLRAVALALVCELVRVLHEVFETGRVDSLVLGGGAANAGYFRTLIAALIPNLPVFHQIESGIAGARGALFAFSRQAARARTRRLRPPLPVLQRRVARAYADYLAAFGSIFSDTPLASPVTFKQ